MVFLDRIKSAMCFFRLVDPHDGLVSLTNVGLIVAIAKLAWAPASPVDFAVLTITLLSYYGKKTLTAKTSQAKELVQETTDKAARAIADAKAALDTVKAVENKVDTLATSMRLTNRVER